MIPSMHSFCCPWKQTQGMRRKDEKKSWPFKTLLVLRMIIVSVPKETRKQHRAQTFQLVSIINN